MTFSVYRPIIILLIYNKLAQFSTAYIVINIQLALQDREVRCSVVYLRAVYRPTFCPVSLEQKHYHTEQKIYSPAGRQDILTILLILFRNKPVGQCGVRVESELSELLLMTLTKELVTFKLRSARQSYILGFGLGCLANPSNRRLFLACRTDSKYYVPTI